MSLLKMENLFFFLHHIGKYFFLSWILSTDYHWHNKGVVYCKLDVSRDFFQENRHKHHHIKNECGTSEISIKLSKVKIKQWHLSSHITGTIIQKSIEKKCFCNISESCKNIYIKDFLTHWEPTDSHSHRETKFTNIAFQIKNEMNTHAL